MAHAGLATALVATLSCGEAPAEPPTPPPTASVPTTVTVTPATVDFTAIGETTRLTAEVRDQFGNVMAGTPVTWSSTATSVATVNSGGVVTAVGNGIATITAIAMQASGTARVTTAQRAASVSVMPQAYTLISGGSVQVAATGRDENGHAMTDVTFSFASSDSAVATVNDSGLVGAISVGTVSVTAALHEFDSASEIVVVVPPRVRTVEITSVPTNGGMPDGAGTWDLPIQQVFTQTLMGTPNPGYDFDRWVEGDATISTEPVYPMQLAGEHEISAHLSVNQESGRWGPGNTYSNYEFPGTGYESLAWTFLPVVDPPESLRRKDLLHYYAYNFEVVNRTSTAGFGYAGFQSDGHLTLGDRNRWGKVINFAIWGSNAARTHGLTNPRNEECLCHQIMLQYEYETGRAYRFELREGPSGVEAQGKWWGLWVKDVAADTITFVGEQRVPAEIDGRPSTLWSPRTSAFGEDLYWWHSRNGSQKYVCSDFEASSLAILDVTAGADEVRPRLAWGWTNSGNIDVAENGYETTLCHVTVFTAENGDVQHNVGFWPEPPENVIER